MTITENTGGRYLHTDGKTHVTVEKDRDRMSAAGIGMFGKKTAEKHAAKHGGKVIKSLFGNRHYVKLGEAVESLSEDLNAALKDLKQELAGGKEYTPEMLKGIADDWEVNPALLIRKFKEATGKDPAEFHVMDKGALDSKLAERAEAKAREIYKQMGFRGGVDILGKKFTYDNKAGKVRPGVAIAYSREGLEYVSVDTGEHRVISFANQHAAANYLHKHLL